jgi:hypothetical protein
MFYIYVTNDLNFFYIFLEISKLILNNLCLFKFKMHYKQSRLKVRKVAHKNKTKMLLLAF